MSERTSHFEKMIKMKHCKNKQSLIILEKKNNKMHLLCNYVNDDDRMILNFTLPGAWPAVHVVKLEGK